MNNTATFALFGNHEVGDQDIWIKDKRFIVAELTSSYDQAVVNEGEFTDNTVTSLLKLVDTDINSAVAKFLSWAERTRSDGSSWLSITLDRLNDRVELLDAESQHETRVLLEDSMDLVERHDGQRFLQDFWMQAGSVYKKTMTTSSPELKHTELVRAARNCQAVSWFSQEVLRRDLWAHGEIDPERVRPDEMRLADLDTIMLCSKILINRLDNFSLFELMKLPRFAGLLYFARDSKIGEPLVERVTHEAVSDATDETLLNFIYALRSSVVSSTEGRYYVIYRNIIGAFFDFVQVRDRIKRVADTGTSESAILALDILRMIERARE